MTNENKKRILLVEDEGIIALSEKMSLEQYGYSVVVVNTGQQAIEAIKSDPEIDLILMDIDLGEEIDGTQVAQIILKYRDIPVIFCSSHTEPEIVEKTEKITSYGYVVKSSSITVFDASIKMAFKLFVANQKIKISDIYQKTMISNISDVICIVDANGIIQYKSPSVERWFGWRPEDLIGTDGWLAVHPDDLDRIQKSFSMLLKKDNSSVTMEFMYKCKDARYKSVEMTAANMTKNPSIAGVLLNYRDITERKQAEETLRKSELRLKEAQQIAHMGSYETDMKTGNSVWSEEFYYIFGIELGTPITDELIRKLVHPDDMKILDQQILEGIQKKAKNGRLEYRIVRSDGAIRWLDSRARLIYDSNGDILKLKGTAIDITERKQAEDEVRKQLAKKIK